MKILDNGIIRDMTPEEEAVFLASVENTEATESDYIEALQDLWVEVDA